MKIQIPIKQIMEKNFPIIDSAMPVKTCARKLNNDAGIIIDQGKFMGIISRQDLIKAMLEEKDFINEIENNKNYKIIKPEQDILEIINLMKKKKIDFIVVKDSKNIIGLITKQDLLEIEPELFDRLEEIT